MPNAPCLSIQHTGCCTCDLNPPNKRKLKKKKIAAININEIYDDILFSVENDIFLKSIFSSFE
ncbi:hypothetical protein Defa_28480 [Desulfovibrio sp. TH_2024_36128]|uniref:Uncharacterized protein n=1 Tax=Desulfovibrio falkowii TaxID=3136602 RepID=A0ABQ0EC67_9BACT